MDDRSTYQPEPQIDTKHHGIFGRLFGLLIFLVVYFLSVGPAKKLADNGVIPGPVVLVLYSPIVHLCSLTPPTRNLADWYLELWSTPPPPPMKP